jgi:DNA-binding NarL/FixJ family response regulator
LAKQVCILETSFIINQGIKQIISGLSDFTISGLFESYLALENSKQLRSCDLLICNSDMIRNSNALTKLKLKREGIKILIVDQEKNPFKDHFTPASVDGYIFLCCHTEEVLKAILAVSRGEKFFCDKALGYILSAREKANSCNPVNLSERELEIVKCIVDGLSSKEISELLSVSFHTITTHRKNICKKLKVNKVSELIATAHKLKLVS